MFISSIIISKHFPFPNMFVLNPSSSLTAR
jgi:hypothetical protein